MRSLVYVGQHSLDVPRIETIRITTIPKGLFFHPDRATTELVDAEEAETWLQKQSEPDIDFI